MILHSHIQGQGPALVLLHGLFGSWENWRSHMRQLASSYRVIGLDLRNHGDSAHSDTMSYEAMAEDVLQTLQKLEVNQFHLLGHSMGGKVAMTLAADPRSHPALQKLIVVDIAPRHYAPHHRPLLEAMQALDSTALASRKAADDALQGAIPEQAVRQFLLKNLERSDGGGYHWRLNLPVLAAEYAQLQGMPAASAAPSRTPLLVVHGSASDYVLPTDETLFAQRFSEYQLTAITGAGHWLHATHAEQVQSSIVHFLAA